jgi:hypothetical protein
MKLFFIKKLTNKVIRLFIILCFIYFLKSILTLREYKINNGYIKDKYALYKKQKFNTLFLGTSLTETGINPLVFDSLLAGSKSFNLGIYGLSTIEYLKFSELVIKETFLNQIKCNKTCTMNVIFELRSPYHIRGFNNYERRNYIEFNDLKTIYNIAFSHYKIPVNRRITIFTTYFFSYVLNILNFGILSDKLKDKSDLNKVYSDQGFYLRTKISQNRIKFNFAKLKNVYCNNLNLDYLNHLNRIIKLAKEKNFNIIFWIPPNLPNWEVDDISFFKNCLNDAKVIDANLNSSLLKQTLWFDNAHLNLEGANLNTKYLLKELKMRNYLKFGEDNE